MMSEMFLWGGLIQADIALPVILGRVGWTLCEWSGRRDSNPRSLGPEPSAIPGFATSRRLEFLARSTGHSVPRSRTECAASQTPLWHSGPKPDAQPATARNRLVVLPQRGRLVRMDISRTVRRRPA